MLYKIEFTEGYIAIDKAVIGRIVMEALSHFNGRVWLSNHKGKVIGLKQRRANYDLSDHMDISMCEKGLDLRVFIVIRFGTSIGMITEQLIQEIKHDLERFTRIEANSIAVVVTGLISKQITKRNIEVKR